MATRLTERPSSLFYPAEFREIFNDASRPAYLVNNAGSVLVHSGRLLIPDGESAPDSAVMMFASLFMNGLGRYFSAKYGMIMGAYSRLAEVPAVLVTEMPYSEALDALALAGTRAAAIAAVVIILLAIITE